MAEMTKVPKGLDRVVVDTTSISAVEDGAGLVYRGYSAIDLAQRASFEKTAFLVFHGKLPSDKELAEFSASLRKNSALGTNVEKMMALLPKDTDMMDLVRTVISAVPTTGKKNDEILMELSAKFPRIISDGYRALKGQQPLPDIDGTYSERLYYLLTGRQDSASAKYLEKLLILYMEHEFNASTWALRVTASTLADPRAAMTTGMATLKGPLHGGANEEILSYMFSIKSKEEAERWVDEKIAKKEKIMGFGHRVYKTEDPRAQLVKRELKTLAAAKGATQAYEAAVAIEAAVWAKKKLPANLDFYGALYMHLLGIDNDLFTPLFAASRAFGWSAHYMEQVTNNKLIRPDAEYVGANGLKLP